MFKIIDKCYDYFAEKEENTKSAIIATVILFGVLMIITFIISFSFMIFN